MRHRILVLAGALLIMPVIASAQATVTMLDYKTDVPASWTPRTPSSSMRLAEYTIGGPGGAEVVAYFFGQGQGGNVVANLQRWRSQFSTPDGSPVPETIMRDTTGAFPVTFAEFRGTYARGTGAGDAANAKPGQILLAGIAETPRGTIFVQMFGPAERVTAERDTFKQFVKGLAKR